MYLYNVMGLISSILVIQSCFSLDYCYDKSPDWNLSQAIEHNSWDVAQYALWFGADVNAQDEAGDTPLIKAARKSYSLYLIILLIESGASVTISNVHGETAFHVARSTAVIDYLNQNSS